LFPGSDIGNNLLALRLAELIPNQVIDSAATRARGRAHLRQRGPIPFVQRQGVEGDDIWTGGLGQPCVTARLAARPT
jgi:hypothetical protein